MGVKSDTGEDMKKIQLGSTESGMEQSMCQWEKAGNGRHKGDHSRHAQQ
jgi:hypothetical protein